MTSEFNTHFLHLNQQFIEQANEFTEVGRFDKEKHICKDKINTLVTSNKDLLVSSLRNLVDVRFRYAFTELRERLNSEDLPEFKALSEKLTEIAETAFEPESVNKCSNIEETIRYAARHPQQTEIDLCKFGDELTDELLIKLIQTCPHITALDIDAKCLTEKSLSSLSNLSNLIKLNINNYRGEKLSLTFGQKLEFLNISNMDQLKDLKLEGEKNNLKMVAIRDNKNLESLTIPQNLHGRFSIGNCPKCIIGSLSHTKDLSLNLHDSKFLEMKSKFRNLFDEKMKIENQYLKGVENFKPIPNDLLDPHEQLAIFIYGT